jgi:hypothetical protein
MQPGMQLLASISSWLQTLEPCFAAAHLPMFRTCIIQYVGGSCGYVLCMVSDLLKIGHPDIFGKSVTADIIIMQASKAS